MSLARYTVPKMLKKRREMADLRYVIWCCINLRPQQMRYDDGFKLFVGILSPEYVDSTMPTNTFDKTLDTLYDRVKKTCPGQLAVVTRGIPTRRVFGSL